MKLSIAVGRLVVAFAVSIVLGALCVIPQLLTFDALSQPVAAQGVCAPYGNPIDGSNMQR